jgi:hypothetical protein
VFGVTREDLRERRTVRSTPAHAGGFGSDEYGNSVNQQVDSGVDGTVQPVVWCYTYGPSGETITHWSDGTTTRSGPSRIWTSPEAGMD